MSTSDRQKSVVVSASRALLQKTTISSHIILLAESESRHLRSMQHQEPKTNLRATPRHLKQGDRSRGVGFDYRYDDEEEFKLKNSLQNLKAHIFPVLVLVILLVLLTLTCYFRFGFCGSLWDPCCGGRRERFGYTPV